MATTEHRIHITADSAQRAAEQIQHVQGAISNFKREVIGLGAAYLGVNGLVNVMKASVAGALEADKVQRQLAFAYKGNTDRLNDFAAQIQKTTIYEDDLVVKQMALLASLKFTRPEMERLIKAATNLSAVTGEDLDSSVQTLIKSTTGVVRELKKYVDGVDKLTPSQLAAGGAITLTQRALEGQAEALANTDFGKLQQAANTWGNLGDKLGELVLPALIGVTNAALQAVDDVKQAGNFWNEFWGFSESSTGADAAAKRLADIRKARKQDAEDAAKTSSHGITGRTPEQIAAEKKLLDDLFESMSKIEDLKQFARDDERAARNATAAVDEIAVANMQIRQDAVAAGMQAERDAYLERARLAREASEQEIEYGAEALYLLQERTRAGKAQVSSTIGGFAQLNSAMKGNAQVTKRLLQAQAIMDTYAGADRALGAYPPPWSFIAAAGVIAAGMANVAQIQAQGFADGGIVRGPGGPRDDRVSARLSPGEGVLTADTVRRLGGAGAIDAMNRGGGGIVVNFQGAVTDRAFVRDTVVPEVVKAVRRALA